MNRFECNENNEFNCIDYHCMYHKVCTKESENIFREHNEYRKRKRENEKKSIKNLLKKWGDLNQ